MKRAILVVIAAAAVLFIGIVFGALMATQKSGFTSPIPAIASTDTSSAAPVLLNQVKTESGKTMYVCPMHPSYLVDIPGDCPICNMTLVPEKKTEMPAMPSTVEGHAAVSISPEGQQLIGVQTGVASVQDVRKRVRAVGVISYNERTLSTVSIKFSGWVERLVAKATGDKVRKGGALFVVYSPDLLEAQRNYVLSLESSDSLGAQAPGEAKAFAQQSVESARERLLLWDISPEQLKELETTRSPQKDITILSKVDGTVIERNVTEGTYVMPGKDLYQIADLSTVWLEADFYEYEIPFVKVGDDVKVTLTSFPGEEITGKVSYVYPYLNKETRTVRVRMEVPNPEGKLKPGMYATVNLEADLGEQLVVDEGAILDTGERQIVFVVMADGMFEPREVVAGEHADGKAVILKGLQAGEKIVTSGNFLVDSESRLKAAPAGGGMPGMPGMAMPAAPGQEGKAGGMENMPGMNMPEKKQEKGTESTGAMEGMPGMSMPTLKEDKGIESMPGMNMPGTGANMESTGGMEGMPGMEMPAEPKKPDGMEAMPGMPEMRL